MRCQASWPGLEWREKLHDESSSRTSRDRPGAVCHRPGARDDALLVWLSSAAARTDPDQPQAAATRATPQGRARCPPADREVPEAASRSSPPGGLTRLAPARPLSGDRAANVRSRAFAGVVQQVEDAFDRASFAQREQEDLGVEPLERELDCSCPWTSTTHSSPARGGRCALGALVVSEPLRRPRRHRSAASPPPRAASAAPRRRGIAARRRRS